MGDPVAVFLYPHIKSGENKVQYQRAKQACNEHDVWFLTRRGVCDEIKNSAKSVEITGGSLLSRIAFPAWLIWRVIMISRENEIEYVRSNHAPQSILAGFVLSLFGHIWIADIYDSPHIGLDLNQEPTDSSRVFARFYNIVLVQISKRVLRLADLIILSIEPIVLSPYKITSSDENVLHVTNGVAVERTREAKTSATPDKFTLVYVGPVRRERGIDTLLYAIQKVDSHVQDIRLRLIGSVKTEDKHWIERKSSDLKNIKVTLQGQVPHDDALAEINESTVGLCPLSLSVDNYRAAYPIKIFEYMALGKPTIATETTGTKAILKDGETGLLVRAGDSDAMAEAILELHNNPINCQEMGRAAAKTVENYDWKIINEEISARIQDTIR